MCKIMLNGFVVSDLHLFARRSDFGSCEAQFRESVAAADVLVLNGDTFDFRWSVHGKLAPSVRQARTWLDVLLADNPKLRVFYLMGNRDAVQPLVEQLDQLSAAHERFSWHANAVRMGRLLFLHGDLWLCKDGTLGTRTYATKEIVWDPIIRFFHRGYLATAIHHFIAGVFHPEPDVPRLAARLQECGAELIDGVTDVYFGHTHTGALDQQCEGRIYHNTGTAIFGLAFLPVEFQVTKEDLPSA